MSAGTHSVPDFSPPGGKDILNLLLVDDNENYCNLLSKGLSEIDEVISVDTISDPASVIEHVETHDVDCVLSDYKMTPLTGLHVLRLVRELHGDIPFILYTSHGDERIASKAITHGATEYVRKKTGGDHYEYLATVIRTAVADYYETQIQNRRQKLAQLTEARGNTGGFEIDIQNGLVIITHGAIDIIDGRNTDSLTETEFYGLFTEENTESIQDAISTVSETGETKTVTIHRMGENNMNRTLKVTVMPAADNNQHMTIRGVIKDVTDTVEKENQMKVFDRVLRHNIRNDLNLIRGHAEMLTATDSEEINKHGEKIICESDQLLDSIGKQRDIMQLLRTDPEYETVNVIRELQRIHKEICETHPHADVSVKTDSSVSIYTSSRITKAIKELVENAVIHNTRENETSVTITARQTQQKLKIQVSDNAELIPEMERGVLLDPDERTPLYHGSGLGLWLIKLVIKECGGSINFSENEPTGNTIQLTIPR